MSKTFTVTVIVGNMIAAVLATWPLGILNAIAAGFLAGFERLAKAGRIILLWRPAPAAGMWPTPP